MSEIVFCAYDPCCGCATHSLPVPLPLEAIIRKASGERVELIKQCC